MSNITGQPLDRVDGRLKVTGGARYAAEIPMTDVVHGVLLKSSIAAGRIRSIDVSAALSSPGVIAVITHLNAPRLGHPTRIPSGDSFPILQGPEIWYSGQSIGIVVADTLPRAEHATELVRVEYDTQPHAASFEEQLNTAYSPGQGRPAKTTRGDLSQGLAAATKQVEATYTTPIYHHNAMEPHATLALWEGDNLTTYNSTQNVNGNKQALAAALGIPLANVRVINHFVGGGFGSKGMSWPHTVIAAVAAQMVKRPVKLSLTREQMYTSNGHRPHTIQKMTLGATDDGKLTALGHDTISHTSMVDDFVEPTGSLAPMLYSCPNVEVSQRLVRLNVGTPTFTRAPGEASGSFALESAMDELAYALQIDPLELRLRNYAERDEGANKPFSSKSLRECYQRGAEAFGWSKRNPTPGSMRDGRYLVGMGMATASYPANFRPSTARALLYADGSLQIQTASHDLGTGTYTVLTQLAADALGIAPEKVRVEIGDTKLPEATGAGGSTSAASVGSAVQAACEALKQKLVQVSTGDKDSPLVGKTPQQVVAENGRIHLKDDANVGETYTQLMNRRGERLIEAQATGQRGNSGGGQAGGSDYSYHGFGAQFMEVRVDQELGTIRVTRAVGAFANGRILNRKTAQSQFQGGMVWGIGMGLLESTYLDAQFGRFANSNLADYLVPVNADVPNIEIIIVDEEDTHVNPIGVKGIGEIGIVGAAAAIANAVYHATGKRIRDLPVTLDKLI